MSPGKGAEPYHKLIKRDIAEITGFNPAQVECDELDETTDGKYKYSP